MVGDYARGDCRPRDQLGSHCRNCGLKLCKADGVWGERKESEEY